MIKPAPIKPSNPVSNTVPIVVIVGTGVGAAGGVVVGTGVGVAGGVAVNSTVALSQSVAVLPSSSDATTVTVFT